MDQLAISVDEEVAVARVSEAVADGGEDFHAEKPLALDAHVERAAGVFHRALFDVDLGVGDLDAQAHVNARGGDVAVLSGGARLFEREKDPIALIKMKELYEVLETATDKAEDAANVLETVVLKGA